MSIFIGRFMIINSNSSLIGQSAVNSQRDFCVSTEDLRKNRTDDIKVVVPKNGEYDGMRGIDLCWTDVWGEQSCSWQDDYYPPENVNIFKEQTCSKAQKENQKDFESIRKDIEGNPWTIAEMRRAMKWIFNCKGRIPVKNCSETAN